MHHRLIDKTFETPLGKVNCSLLSNISSIAFIKNKNYNNGIGELYNSQDFQIEIIEFKVKLPLYNGGIITDSKGWIWRIIRKSESSEKLEIECRFLEPIANLSYDYATGQHIDAVEVNNNEWILHIGTEDGEILNDRAINNDWFPSRLKNADYYQSITEMKNYKFNSWIPDLAVEERIYLQYICAYDKQPNNPENINTWIAVDEYKGNLENWIGTSTVI